MIVFRLQFWAMISITKGPFLISLPEKYKLWYVLIDWVGWPEGKIFGSGHGQICSCPALPNSVNSKHFIIWKPHFSLFLFLFVFFFSCNKIRYWNVQFSWNVAHFDWKVGIYIPTKLFQFASRKEPYVILAGLDSFFRPCSCHCPHTRILSIALQWKAHMGPYGSWMRVIKCPSHCFPQGGQK